MSNVVSPFQQKILAVCLLALLIWMILAGMLMPAFSNLSERRDQIQLLERRIQNYQRVLASEDYLKSRLEELGGGSTVNLFYMAEVEDGLNAELTSDVRDIFSNVGINVENMRSGLITEEDGMKRLSVQISATLYMADFVSVLRSVRNHQKILSLENISVEADGRQDIATPLAVRFDVVGFGVLNMGAADT